MQSVNRTIFGTLAEEFVLWARMRMYSAKPVVLPLLWLQRLFFFSVKQFSSKEWNSVLHIAISAPVRTATVGDMAVDHRWGECIVIGLCESFSWQHTFTSRSHSSLREWVQRILYFTFRLLSSSLFHHCVARLDWSEYAGIYNFPRNRAKVYYWSIKQRVATNYDMQCAFIFRYRYGMVTINEKHFFNSVLSRYFLRFAEWNSKNSCTNRNTKFSKYWMRLCRKLSLPCHH